jgi:hypothetical protein
MRHKCSLKMKPAGNPGGFSPVGCAAMQHSSDTHDGYSDAARRLRYLDPTEVAGRVKAALAYVEATEEGARAQLME